MNYLFIHGFISSELAQAICRTLLHSMWQGLLAAVIAGIIITVTKKTKASVRYNLLSFTLIAFAIGSFVTFLNQLAIAEIVKTDKVIQLSSKESPSEVVVNNEHWLPALHKDAFYQPIIYYADKSSLLITGIWLFFFFMHLVRMTTGLHYANRLRRQQVIPPADQWAQQLQQLKENLGIRAAVSLMESALVKVPVVIGILKPVILVPLGMLTNLSPRQVETILLHELAHVYRRDFAVNLLQRVIESFFFFNPFIIWLSARIREEREACCDDIVMQHISDKRSYLEALISFRQPEVLSYGHAMTLGQKNNLLYRVKRMITQENKKLNAMEKLTLIFVLVAAGAFSFIPVQKEKVIKKKAATVQRELQPQSLQEAVEKTATKQTATIKPGNDTLPEKKHITFNNISRTINDDGTARKVEVSARGSDGKTYNYRLLNDKIVEMTINGVKVKEEDLYRYDSIVDEIEASWKEAISKSSLKRQKDFLELRESKELLNERLMKPENDQLLDLKKSQQLTLKHQKLADVDMDNQKLLQNKLLLQKENDLDLIKLDKDNSDLIYKKLALQDEQLQKLKAQQNAAELLEKKEFNMKNELLVAQDEQFHDTNYQLSAILAELAEAGVIADKNNFSFTLNNDELIVDGKKQSAELHESLRKKYIKHKKDYFKYKAKPNSRSTDVYVE